MKREKIIEGITFDLQANKQGMEEQGKEKFTEHIRNTCWNETNPPINQATKEKRVKELIDSIEAYTEGQEDAAAAPAATGETEVQRKAREKKEREDAAASSK